jgi:hypothetical protein
VPVPGPQRLLSSPSSPFVTTASSPVPVPRARRTARSKNNKSHTPTQTINDLVVQPRAGPAPSFAAPVTRWRSRNRTYTYVDAIHEPNTRVWVARPAAMGGNSGTEPCAPWTLRQPTAARCGHPRVCRDLSARRLTPGSPPQKGGSRRMRCSGRIQWRSSAHEQATESAACCSRCRDRRPPLSPSPEPPSQDRFLVAAEQGLRYGNPRQEPRRTASPGPMLPCALTVHIVARRPVHPTPAVRDREGRRPKKKDTTLATHRRFIRACVPRAPPAPIAPRAPTLICFDKKPNRSSSAARRARPPPAFIASTACVSYPPRQPYVLLGENPWQTASSSARPPPPHEPPGDACGDLHGAAIDACPKRLFVAPC